MNERTRVTRPDLSSDTTSDEQTSDQPQTTDETAKTDEPAAEQPAATVTAVTTDNFTRPFRAEGAYVLDGQGREVAVAGMGHLGVEQRGALAEWLASELNTERAAPEVTEG